MKTKKREAQERKKAALVRNKAREVGKLLEPGERVSGVALLQVDWHALRRNMAVFAVCNITVATLWLLFGVSNVLHSRGFLSRIPRGDYFGLLLILATQIGVQLFITKVRKAERTLALTDRRVLLLRSALKGGLWSSPLAIEVADPIGEVKVDAIRSVSPSEFAFGLRRDDGSTTELFFRKQWLPEVEWLASCLDAGVAAPRRPDVLSASA